MWGGQSNFILFFFLMFIYFWERDRQSESRGRTEREGDTELEAGSRLQLSALCSVLVGLKLTNYEIMTWAEVGGLTDWATRVPPKNTAYIFKLKYAIYVIAITFEVPINNFIILWPCSENGEWCSDHQILKGLDHWPPRSRINRAMKLIAA